MYEEIGEQQTLSMESSMKSVYVLVPPSPLFAAHWSLFIPDSEDSSCGRRIHVSGDRLNGFELEIIRAYDISLHRSVRLDRRFRVGVVSSCSVPDRAKGPEHVQKDEDEGGGYVDTHAVDELEDICLEVEPPGPSLNRIDADGATGKRMKTVVKDCQWWVRQVVSLLCSRGILHASPSVSGSEDRSPVTIVESLPVH